MRGVKKSYLVVYHIGSLGTEIRKAVGGRFVTDWFYCENKGGVRFVFKSDVALLKAVDKVLKLRQQVLKECQLKIEIGNANED